jgi:hypothetical protein
MFTHYLLIIEDKYCDDDFVLFQCLDDALKEADKVVREMREVCKGEVEYQDVKKHLGWFFLAYGEDCWTVSVRGVNVVHWSGT